MVVAPMKSRCHVDVVDFQTYEDGKHKFILIFQDCVTKFLVLRPLEDQSVGKVACVLLDIFSLLGAPCILESHSGLDFCRKLIEELKMMWPELRMVYGKQRNQDERKEYEDIPNLLVSWMQEQNCYDWIMGLKFVQITKNRGYHPSVGKSPYEAMFGVPPNVGLLPHVSSEVLDQIASEEDLERALQGGRDFWKDDVCNLGNNTDDVVRPPEMVVCKQEVLSDDEEKLEQPLSISLSPDPEAVSGMKQEIPYKYADLSGNAHENSEQAGGTFWREPEVIVDSESVITKEESVISENVSSAVSDTSDVDLSEDNEETEEQLLPSGTDIPPNFWQPSNNGLILHPGAGEGVSFSTDEVFRPQIHWNHSLHPFMCEKCCNVFSLREELDYHVCSPSGSHSFRCHVCGLGFMDGDMLIKHMECLHTDDKPFGCPTCKTGFPCWQALLKHFRVHSKDRPFECKICKRRYLHKQELMDHSRMHTGEKPHTCPTCNKNFSHRKSLAIHLRIHTGEKPYECDTCKKRFAQQGSLLRHLRTHSQEKGFDCSMCGKSYSRQEHLLRHFRTHTGEKPYKCSLCKKNFSHRENLSRHLRTLH